MTLQGTIRGGMVVLDEPVQVPEGTKVSVFVPERGKDPDWRPADDPELTEQMWTEAARIHFRGSVIVGKDLLEV